MSHRQLLDRWFYELWGKRNARIIDEIVDPDCKIHGLPGTVHGPDGFRPFYDLFGSSFAEIDVRIDESLEQEDRIAFRSTAKVLGHDGKQCQFTGGGIVRFRDGRMIEAWNQWDFLTLLGSLGHASPTAIIDAMRERAVLR